MSIYSNIYYKLCESKKQAKTEYKPFSGLHEHHILPKHSGGDDSESNLTYLTLREHIIAHFLLWKIYKNPNDLRSLKMLGANLTPEKRKIIGKWCRDNKIGFHGSSEEEKKVWRERGLETQKTIIQKIHFITGQQKKEEKKDLLLAEKLLYNLVIIKSFFFGCLMKEENSVLLWVENHTKKKSDAPTRKPKLEKNQTRRHPKFPLVRLAIWCWRSIQKT